MKNIVLTAYTDFIVEEAKKLLAVDSPTGYTREAAALVMQEFAALGYTPTQTVKGGVLVQLSEGKGETGGLMLAAHSDTLGAMVSQIKPNGRLQLTPLGGMNANNAETENVRVVTKFDGVVEGTCQLVNASTHVNGSYNDTKREWSAMEIVLDEPITSAEEAKARGLSVGDIVCFDPRTRVTSDGYIKSRFLDDKLSVAILLGYAKYLKDTGVVPTRPIWAHITVYEEVGHGGSGSVPAGVTEAIAVDMGCVGDGLACTERQVSICAKDSRGPYCYEVVKALTEAAIRSGADYAVDVYPFYGSDVEATLTAGHDITHGLIGPGVYASHGYERSHRLGAENTLRLLLGYTL